MAERREKVFFACDRNLVKISLNPTFAFRTRFERLVDVFPVEHCGLEFGDNLSWGQFVLLLCLLPSPFAFCFLLCLFPLPFAFSFAFCLLLCLLPFPFAFCLLPLPFAFSFAFCLLPLPFSFSLCLLHSPFAFCLFPLPFAFSLCLFPSPFAFCLLPLPFAFSCAFCLLPFCKQGVSGGCQISAVQLFMSCVALLMCIGAMLGQSQY